MPAKFNTLSTTAARAVQDGVVPGLVVLAGTAGQVVFHEAFGSRQVEPEVLPTTPRTVYDLASLTKALVTSLLALRAVQDGRINLDDRVATHSPHFRGADRAQVTIRQLLCHASGLPAHTDLWKSVATAGTPGARDSVVALAAATPLGCLPGTRSLYSDLGFILLGDLLERVHGDRLDRLATREIFAPLGLPSLSFAPGPHSPDGPVAPTERCPVRGRLLAGEVHDLNAWAMGGVAGHAGLFGHAADVGTLCAALCQIWRGQGGASAGMGALALDRDLLRTFWSPCGVAGSTWRLGWDGPAASASLAGERISRAAVGHLGFTGTSLWIDPARAVFVVVLSNRVHPAVRDDPRFRTLRPALNDAALDGLGYLG
jgi:CubicO group peptidase (beta-lactamase class C family)